MQLNPKELASMSPEAALLLRQGGLVPVLLTIALTWDANTGIVSGSKATGSLSSPIGSTTWIYRVDYTVERPNADTGSVLKGQNDFFTTRTPYVDINILVPYAPISYLLTPDVVPLAGLFEMCFNWRLRKNATVSANGFLTRDLQASENPYRVKVLLGGFQLDPTLDLAEIIGKVDPAELQRACGCGSVAEYERKLLG